MTDKLTVLVTGATGQQGGAAARALLDKGHSVRALTRNPDSDAAKALETAGAEIRGGDFNDPATLAEAAQGVDTAFLVSTFDTGTDQETEKAIAAIDALKQTGVGHVIYTSVASADQKTGIPHFDSKHAVEKHLAESGVNYTISAPVWFMDNLLAPWLIDGVRGGAVPIALPAEKPLQQVAVADIGAFVAALAERREKVFGKRYDIAGDTLTGPEAAQHVSAASGRAFNYYPVPLEAVREQSEDMAAMFEWFDKVGYSVDVADLHTEFPEVEWTSFADWAKATDWSVLDAEKAA